MWKKIKKELTEYMDSIHLFQKNIKYFLFTAFFIGLGNSIYMLMYNLYLKSLHFNEGFIGSVLAFSALGSAIFAIPIAFLLQKIRIKKILSFIPILLSISILLQTFVVKKEVILLASFLKGFSMTSFMIMSGPFFMKNSTPKERTHIFSIAFAINLASGFLGNIFGGSLFKIFSFLNNSIAQYQIVFSLAVIFILLSYFFLFRVHTTNIEKQGIPIKEQLRHFPYKFVFKIAFPQFIIGLGAGMLIPFLNLFFRYKWHIYPEKLGIVFAISQFFMFFGILTGPILKKYFGMMKSVVITQLFSIPFFYLLGFSNSLYIVIASFFLRATLMNMSQPLVTNFALENVGKEFQFLTNSINSTAWLGAWIFSSFIGGKIIEKFGFNYVFIITIILYFIASLFYYFFFVKKNQKNT